MCLSDEGASDTKSEILLSAAMELLPLIMSKYVLLAQQTRDASESSDTEISNESWWKSENVLRKICEENFSSHSMFSVLSYHSDKDFLSDSVWRTRSREK